MTHSCVRMCVWCAKVLVGARSDNGGEAPNSGAVYAFSRPAVNITTWTAAQGRLVAKDGAAGDAFGQHLDISKDGKVAVVASVNAQFSKGRLYVFDTGAWVPARACG